MEKTFSEKQIIQMAQKEETILNEKMNYLSRVESLMKDTILTIESLKEIEKNPSKILVKIGVGVMMEVEIKETKCKRAFSENGFKDESIKDTIKWLEKRKENIKSQITKIQKDTLKSQQKLQKLFTILKQIKKEKQKNISVK